MAQSATPTPNELPKQACMICGRPGCYRGGRLTLTECEADMIQESLGGLEYALQHGMRLPDHC